MGRAANGGAIMQDERLPGRNEKGHPAPIRTGCPGVAVAGGARDTADQPQAVASVMRCGSSKLAAVSVVLAAALPSLMAMACTSWFAAL